MSKYTSMSALVFIKVKLYHSVGYLSRDLTSIKISEIVDAIDSYVLRLREEIN